MFFGKGSHYYSENCIFFCFKFEFKFNKTFFQCMENYFFSVLFILTYIYHITFL